MKKRLYIVGGTMGVGKTTVCKCLRDELDNCAFLDGDWCWNMHPFQVTEETKAMVMDNICHTLNGFLGCSVFENVIFCWVMHEQPIIDELLAKLHTEGWEVLTISLLCTADTLRQRLGADVAAGVRTEDVIERSLARIPLYEKLNTRKVSTDGLTPAQAAEKLKQLD